MDCEYEKELGEANFAHCFNGRGCFRHYNCQHHRGCYMCGGKPRRIERHGQDRCGERSYVSTSKFATDYETLSDYYAIQPSKQKRTTW